MLMNMKHPAGVEPRGSPDSTDENRNYHIKAAEMWLELIALIVLIGVMFAVGFHLF
jgi:hypothetical protein